MESHLGDIVVGSLHFTVLETRVIDRLSKYYALYSHLGNWTELTHPALVSMFPIPQRYYVPGRIRESYRPRLEASGMWGLQTIEKNENKPFKKINKGSEKEEHSQKFHEAFGKEKVKGAPEYLHHFNQDVGLG